MSARKRNSSDVRSWKTPTRIIDEEAYRTTVLRLSQDVTEDDIDEHLAQQAEILGIVPLFDQDTGHISSSLSVTTLASESQNQPPVLSPSTVSTSCSSSEHRTNRQASIVSEKSSPSSPTLSILSEAESKKSFGFRRGFRKMATFTKRRSSLMTTSTLDSINSDMSAANHSDRASMKSELKSPASIKSSKSSWSSPPLILPKPVEETPMLLDQEALQRSMDSSGLREIRDMQLEERKRFLDFQQALVDELHCQRDIAKARRRQQFEGVVEEAQVKMDRAIEDLESRQLEEEMKMQKEHDMERRVALIRLRHMEAYCQNPTPPPTPVDPVSGRPSFDNPLPERRVTEKDYHNLAQQYRDRDAMETLQASKINVLRGRQKKAVENYSKKKESEIDNLEREHHRDLDRLDIECAAQEANLRLALGTKQARLEGRWRTRSLLERTKMERATGLKYAALPDLTAGDDGPLGLAIEYTMVGA